MASINKYRRELQTIYDRGVQLGDLVIVSNERFLKLIKMLDDDIGHRLAQRDEDDAALLARLHDALADHGQSADPRSDSEQINTDTAEPDLDHLQSNDFDNDIDGDAGSNFDPDVDENDDEPDDSDLNDDPDFQQASNADTQEDDLIDDDGSQTDDDSESASDEPNNSDFDQAGPDPNDEEPQFDDTTDDSDDDIFNDLDGNLVNNSTDADGRPFDAGNFTRDTIEKHSQQAAKDFEAQHQQLPPVSGSTSVQSSMPSASSSVSQSKPAVSSEDSGNRFGTADE